MESKREVTREYSDHGREIAAETFARVAEILRGWRVKSQSKDEVKHAEN
jgi:hypothetical protein